MDKNRLATTENAPSTLPKREQKARAEDYRKAYAERRAREQRLNQDRLVALALRILVSVYHTELNDGMFAVRCGLPPTTDMAELITEIRRGLSPLVRSID